MIIDSHTSDAANVKGLARAIQSMRWKDLELVALEVEEWRGGGKAKLSADHLSNWANSFLENTE